MSTEDEKKAKAVERMRLWRKNNLEKYKSQGKKWREDNREYIENYQKEYRILNNEVLKEKNKIRNLDIIRITDKLNYSKSEKGKEQRRKTRKLTINDKWRGLLNNCLKRMGKTKEGHTIDLLGYSSIELKEHIELLFIDGMSWDNHGEWHIDHKKAVSLFNKETHPSIVNALSNLQPLWAIDNIKKSNKIIL
jgi:hypothetical protein